MNEKDEGHSHSNLGTFMQKRVVIFQNWEDFQQYHVPKQMEHIAKFPPS